MRDSASVFLAPFTGCHEVEGSDQKEAKRGGSEWAKPGGGVMPSRGKLLTAELS